MLTTNILYYSKVTPILFIICLISQSIGCSSQESILEETKKEIKSEEKYLNIEVLKFRQKTLQQIEVNIRSIEDFNSILDTDESIVKTSFKAKIGALEFKNADLKIKLDNYQVEGEKNWNEFKNDFNIDLYRLNNDIKEVSKIYLKIQNNQNLTDTLSTINHPISVFIRLK